MKLDAQSTCGSTEAEHNFVTTRQDKDSRPAAHRTVSHVPQRTNIYTLHVNAALEGASNVTVMAVDSVRVSE